ncbi:MAG: hypothetical protein A3D28_00980 [Omnitrophica bacterium RIFCSPHIGHO2_02_FULL_63_14]|nr:MAG: hypothetical protein A3D28_00980 [Omnitrophica bacterium RIFCSPHIGHO2_02_FULL_63_14]
MVEDQHIKQWLAEGLITQQQAQKMFADVIAHRKERSSDKLIVAVSTIGAILLGVGAVLFVASNWQVLTNLAKVFIMAGSTFGVAYMGYVFAYERQNLPKVGAALLFLGTLLFGATIFLIAQIYHIQANSHLLVLIWLAGILPLVYVLQSVPIAGLSALLLFIWIGLFVFRNITLSSSDWIALPVLYLLSGLLFFETGGVHYLSEKLRTVARTYRIASLKVTMVSLFLLTFRFFSGHYEHWSSRQQAAFSPQMSTGIVVLAVVAILLASSNLFFNPSKSETWQLEGGVSLGLIGLSLVFFFFPSTTNIYVVIFNLVLAGCIGVLIAIGYQREDIRLVNIGMSYLALLVVVRYCDFFWGLLSRSVFFMVGGAILVLGGIAMEQKRRQLKAQFTQ